MSEHPKALMAYGRKYQCVCNHCGEVSQEEARQCSSQLYTCPKCNKQTECVHPEVFKEGLEQLKEDIQQVYGRFQTLYESATQLDDYEIASFLSNVHNSLSLDAVEEIDKAIHYLD